MQPHEWQPGLTETAGLYRAGDTVTVRVRRPWRPWRWGRRRYELRVFRCIVAEKIQNGSGL